MDVPELQQPGIDREQILSVSQLTSLIKDSLQTAFPSVWVAGEISNLSRPQSGHNYFTLKDAGAQLRAVIWRGAASRLQFDLQDGMEVLCNGEIDVYPPRGSYQVIVRQIEPRGQGALQLALRQLRARLASEGLFDAKYKKPLPTFPRRIAVVTSPTGAAIRDFLEVAERRWQGVEIMVVPARVQGAEAAAEIAMAIETCNQLVPLPDVVVLARGGGSLEDLWCFNEEVVVRTIFHSRIPLVSAVGHEIDVTLADLVADVRALTPSEAAERVVPSAEEAMASLLHLGQRMALSVRNRIDNGRALLSALAERRVLRRPRERIHDLARQLDEMEIRSQRAAHRCVSRAGDQLRALTAQLESLSPLAVLGRGYSLTTRAVDGCIIHHAEQVVAGELIHTQLARGQLVSRVEQQDARSILPGNGRAERTLGGDNLDQEEKNRK